MEISKKTWKLHEKKLRKIKRNKIGKIPKNLANPKRQEKSKLLYKEGNTFKEKRKIQKETKSLMKISGNSTKKVIPGKIRKL